MVPGGCKCKNPVGGGKFLPCCSTRDGANGDAASPADQTGRCGVTRELNKELWDPRRVKKQSNVFGFICLQIKPLMGGLGCLKN